MTTETKFKHYVYVTYNRGTLKVRGVTEDGRRLTTSVDFSPTIWVDKRINYRKWRSRLKSEDTTRFNGFYGERLTALTFETISDCEEFLKEHSTGKYDSDLESGIYTAPNNKYVSQYMCECFSTESTLQPEQMKVYLYDIETETGHRNVPNTTKVQIRKKSQETEFGTTITDSTIKEVTIEEFEKMPQQTSYELYDGESDSWVSYETHPYRFIGGFPSPEVVSEKLTLITVKELGTGHITTWGLYDFKPTNENTEYRQFETEESLLLDFIKWFSADYPDIFCGFNSAKFDNLYLANRIEKVLGAKYSKMLSPFGKIVLVKRKDPKTGSIDTECEFEGIVCLDYLKLYKKWGCSSQRESYKLDSIGEDEVGVKKVPNPTGGSFRDFYTGVFKVYTKPTQDDDEILKLGYIRTVLEKKMQSDESLRPTYDAINTRTIKACQQRFIEYNIRDVELIELIEKKLKLFNICTMVAYLAHENIADAFSPVITWDHTIYNHLWRRNVVIPEDIRKEKNEKYAGAFVKNEIGKYDYCASFDLDSEYPHVIMGFNISPETMVRKPTGEPVKVKYKEESLINKTEDTSFAHNNNYSISASGYAFRRDRQGVIPYLCEHYYAERKKHKKRKLYYESEYSKIMTELRRRGENV